MREVALDYGMQFAQRQRGKIESLIRTLRESLERDDDRGIDQIGTDLQDALYDLNQEVSVYTNAEEDDDLFGSIRRTFTGEPRRRDFDYDSRDYMQYDNRRNVTRSRTYYQTQSEDWDDRDDDWL